MRDGFSCDGCGAVLAAGDTAFSSRESLSDDYDLCRRCCMADGTLQWPVFAESRGCRLGYVIGWYSALREQAAKLVQGRYAGSYASAADKFRRMAVLDTDRAAQHIEYAALLDAKGSQWVYHDNAGKHQGPFDYQTVLRSPGAFELP